MNSSHQNSEGGVQQLVRKLAGAGWNMDTFTRNQLGVAASVEAGRDVGQMELHRKYWRTAALISTVLQEHGIYHVIIKTRRHYPYADSNVDVFIEEREWPRVRSVLCQEHWRMPSRPVILKQRLIEREKIKLPPVTDSVVPAHMYMAVSWRYQREVTFLDPAMVEQVPISEEAPYLEGEFPSLRIPMPTRTADVLLHAAEIAFENYRLTVGEAAFLTWLSDTITESEWQRICDLARQRGAEQALIRVVGMAKAVSGTRAEDVGLKWPENLSLFDLLASWGDRFAFQVRRRPVAALEEWLGYAGFASMYYVKRKMIG